MASRALIGNVVLGLGVIGLGALVIAERGVTEAARTEAEALAVAPAEPEAAPVASSGTAVPVAVPVAAPVAAPEPVAAPAPVAAPTPVPVAVADPMPEPAASRRPLFGKSAAPAGRPADDLLECEAPPEVPSPLMASLRRAGRMPGPLLEAIPPERLKVHPVQPGDTLIKLARAYKVTIGLIRRLNGIEDDLIRVGERLAIPEGPFRAEIDRKGFSLAIHLDGHTVRKYAIGTGRGGSTPEGEFEVRSRVEDPEWTSPEGDFFASGDPANPLGSRWLGFGESGYGIHGTDDPSSIGRESSRGCVRLNGDDVLEVYDLLGLGATVVIR